MAVFNDRTSVVAFYYDGDAYCCSETYQNAKDLIFGCKTPVVFVDTDDGGYTNMCFAMLDSEGMTLEFQYGESKRTLRMGNNTLRELESPS